MNEQYRAEAAALDAEILHCIETREVADFNALALRIFAHQLRYNEPYARYCATFGFTPDSLPGNWDSIPPVPSAAFKEAALCTFDLRSAALTFETSGTTQGRGGKHFMETAALYDAALLAGFSDAILRDARAPLRYLMLVPNPAERPQSSLGYMMQKAAHTYGDGGEAWYLRGESLQLQQFVSGARHAIADAIPVCIAGTAFAFVQLLDALDELDAQPFALPAGSRIMETGGFKGRTRVVERDELYRALAKRFCIAQEHIIAEYGMTELSSQYYDRPGSAPRAKTGPPWMRARITGLDGRSLPAGITGALVHVDLANRSSCVAVQTEDLGVELPDGGFLLIGRDAGAELRGCSLDAEQLRA